MVECSLLKELKLMAKKMVKWGAVTKRRTSSDEAQQKKTAKFESRVEIFKGQPAVWITAPKKNKT